MNRSANSASVSTSSTPRLNAALVARSASSIRGGSATSETIARYAHALGLEASSTFASASAASAPSASPSRSIAAPRPIHADAHGRISHAAANTPRASENLPFFSKHPPRFRNSFSDAGGLPLCPLHAMACVYASSASENRRSCACASPSSSNGRGSVASIPSASAMKPNATSNRASRSEELSSFATNPSRSSSSSSSSSSSRVIFTRDVSFVTDFASRNAARAKHSLCTSRSSSRSPAFSASGSNTPRSSAERATEGMCMSRHSSAVLTCAAGPTSSASSDASVSFKRFRGDAPIRFAIAVAVRRRAWNAQLAASVSRSSLSYVAARSVHATSSPGAAEFVTACPNTSARWYSSSRRLRHVSARSASTHVSSARSASLNASSAAPKRARRDRNAPYAHQTAASFFSVSKTRSWCHFSASTCASLISYSSARRFKCSEDARFASSAAASDSVRRLSVSSGLDPKSASAACISSTKCTYSSSYLASISSRSSGRTDDAVKNRDLTISLAAFFKRSFMSWYFPLRFSSNTSRLRRIAAPSGAFDPSSVSSGAPVNIAAYSSARPVAARVTSSRNARAAAASADSSDTTTGSRAGKSSATEVSAGRGGAQGGSRGRVSATVNATRAGAGAAAHATAPGGTAGSSPCAAAPSGHAAGTGRQLCAPYSGALRNARSGAHVTQPGSSSASIATSAAAW